jgi:hypothetical protein
MLALAGSASAAGPCEAAHAGTLAPRPAVAPVSGGAFLATGRPARPAWHPCSWRRRRSRTRSSRRCRRASRSSTCSYDSVPTEPGSPLQTPPGTGTHPRGTALADPSHAPFNGRSVRWLRWLVSSAVLCCARVVRLVRRMCATLLHVRCVLRARHADDALYALCSRSAVYACALRARRARFTLHAWWTLYAAWVPEGGAGAARVARAAARGRGGRQARRRGAAGEACVVPAAHTCNRWNCDCR